MAGEQNLVEIVLGADAKQVSAAVAAVTKAMNAAEQTAAAQKRQAEIATNLGRRLADANERIANAARARLSIEDRITQAKERQARIERRLASDTTGHQRTALELARRRNDVTLQGLMREQEGSRMGPGGLLRGAMNAVGIGHWADRYDRGKEMLGALETAGISRGMLGRAALGIVAPMVAGGLVLRSASRWGQELEQKSSGIRTMSRRMGIGTGDAQALQYAGEASGLGVDRVQGMMMDLIEAQGQARMGSKELVDAFQLWGVSLDDVRRKNPVELFRQLTGAIKDGRLTAEQFSVGMRLLGRDFKELGPDIGMIVKKMDEFQSGGLGLSNQTIENASTGKKVRGAIGARVGAKVGQAKSWLGEGWNRIKDKFTYTYGGWMMTPEERDQLLASIGSKGFGEEYDVSGAGASEAQARLDAKIAAKKAKQDDQYAAFLDEWDAMGVAMDKAEKSKEQRAGKSGLGVSEADQLARIGLFRGGLVTPDLRIQEQQLVELKAAVSELRALTRMESED